jgi:hypothetical protein
MNTAFRTAVIVSACLLPQAGCSHRNKVLPPQQAQAPVPPPYMMAHYPALPPLPPPNAPRVELASVQETPPAPRPHRASHRKPSPAKTSPASETTTEKQPQQQTTEVASAAPAPDASPIGQLTAGEDATNIQQRRDVEQLITNTENGLDRISRNLNTDEQKTAVQIRTFLTKAKQALADNDLDGANTLATKAKVLLNELTKK